MRVPARAGFALVVVLTIGGAGVGCGDNAPRQFAEDGAAGTDDGAAGGGLAGAGGNGGGGGSAGRGGTSGATDAKADQRDGAGDGPDGNGGSGGTSGATDVRSDRNDAIEGGGAAGTGGAGGSIDGPPEGPVEGGARGGNDGGSNDGDADGSGNDAVPDAPAVCYAVSFIRPVDLAMFSAADDKNGDNCADGFQQDVQIATDAPNGTDVSLFVDGASRATVKAVGGKATFVGVTLPTSGEVGLDIGFPTRVQGSCAGIRVTVDCRVPVCVIGRPIISPAHPALNGVSVVQGGDRVSATGAPYEVGFEVATNIGNNQIVALDIADVASASTAFTVIVRASGGKAIFLGVPLPSETTYAIQARCVDGNGVVGRSVKGMYPVDTTPPQLTISKPASGDFIGPSDVTAGTFLVCGRTTSDDAVSLDAALGSRVSNYCVTIVGAPGCVPMMATGTDACVNVPCLTLAPFDITVALTDAAGNPQTKTISDVSCATTLPAVQIVSPVSDAPTFTEPAKHLLGATAPQALRDQSGATPGAQTDVVACATRAGTATLFSGHQGDATLVQVGSPVGTRAAVPADGCPAGFGFAVTFSGATLPESTEKPDTSLLAATELRVDLTDLSGATNGSAPLDLWVDTGVPTLTQVSPLNLCGSFHQTPTTFVAAVTVSSTGGIGSVTKTDDVGMVGFTSMNFPPSVTFPALVFNQGQSVISGMIADRAGNSSVFQPNPCIVTVGAPPIITFTTPTDGKRLCAATATATDCINDADAAAPGWQGSLIVGVTVSGAPVKMGNVAFSDGMSTLGVAMLDASGHAQLLNVTLLEGAVGLTAQTEDISGHGVGSATINVVVDLTP
jgi:hypothetical protein